MAAYRKENGFLGIVSYREGEEDGLFIASKSTNHGEYAGYFKKILHDTLDQGSRIIMSELLRRMNCSAVFEVIDPDNDPHIVKYDKPKIVLLALIINAYEYYNYCYYVVEEFAKVFHLECKKRDAVLRSWEELQEFMEEHRLDRNREGYVFEDNNLFMFKFKNDW